MLLRELKQGEFFTKKKIDDPKESQVWVRDEYDRSIKKYLIHRFDDVNNTQELKGDTEVYTEFTF